MRLRTSMIYSWFSVHVSCSGSAVDRVHRMPTAQARSGSRPKIALPCALYILGVLSLPLSLSLLRVGGEKGRPGRSV